MPDVELAHRPGVELVNAGSWQLLSGSWNPNRKDILAAVEAAQCPAVRRPKLKLGHLDPRFNAPDEAQHDGTPSLGWFDNLRASDDGNTLIGDQVALPWLSKVQAAAYPDRSVEGKHNARCALGHVHPFVITAVSLLGETPPGIPTLKSIKSIDDLPAALGVAASGEVTEGGQDVQATVRAAAPAPDGDGDEDDEPTGAMVALIPTPDDAARLVVDGGETADQLHLTLAYLGDASDLDASTQQDLIDAVSTAVNGMPVVDADIFSVAGYNLGDDTDRDACLVYQLSGDLLAAVQEALDDALDGIDQSQEPWFAHITALWSDDLGRLPDLVANMGPVSFDRVRIAVAGQTVDIPLIDDPQPDPDMVDYGDPTGGVYAANAPGGNTDRLKKYWLAGPGLAKWADKPHPWTALYKQLLKYIKSPDEAKRTASQWYREHFGRMPNQTGVHASAEHPFDEGKHKRDGHGKFAHQAGSHIAHASEGKDGGDKASAASRTVRIRDSGGEPMFLEFSGGSMSLRFPYDGDTGEGDDSAHHGADHFDTLKLDKATTGDFADELATISETRDAYVKKAKAASDRLDQAEASGGTHSAEYKAAQDAWFQVGGDGQRILGGELPGDKGTLVYEMRMGTEVNDTEFLMALKPPDAPDDWDLNEAASDQAGAFLNQAQFKRLKKEVDASTSVAASAATPVLPAAEPEHEIQPIRRRTSCPRPERIPLAARPRRHRRRAGNPVRSRRAEDEGRHPTPAEPTPEMVAASAAAVEQAKAAEAEKDELRKEVQILASQMKNVSDELASAKAEKAATVKASVFEAAIKDGKIKPARP